MDDARYEALSQRSHAVHGHQQVLPVAVWLAESGQVLVKTPEVTRGLDGRRQSGEVLSALERLCEIEALREMPHVGAPSPRSFEPVDHPYWAFVRAIAEIVDENLLQPLDQRSVVSINSP
jgi:hypothetical protein